MTIITQPGVGDSMLDTYMRLAATMINRPGVRNVIFDAISAGAGCGSASLCELAGEDVQVFSRSDETFKCTLSRHDSCGAFVLLLFVILHTTASSGTRMV